jgi:hypothetical protein
LYKIFGLFSLKKFGIWRDCAPFIFMPKASSDKNVCAKMALESGQESVRTPTGERKNKASNARMSCN